MRASRLGVAGALTAVVLTPALLFADSLLVTRALEIGDRGEDVSALQMTLASDPSIYPERLVTGYFGLLTRAAVRRFQEREGIVSGGDEGSTGLWAGWPAHAGGI